MNPFFSSFQQSRQQAASTPCAPPSNLGDLLQNVASRLMPTQMNAEQMVRRMIDSGAVTQEQFNWAAGIANQWTGQK